MAQTYKFGNGTWARKKGSTLAYSDTNNAFKPLPFSFERNSIGTRVNKEGLIEVVGNDIPRIDYTDSAEGALLLENSATNLVTYSEDFANSSVWGTANTTFTDNETQSPSGLLTGKLTRNATSFSCIRDLTTSTVLGTTYVFSAFYKKDTETTINHGVANETTGYVTFNFDTETISITRNDSNNTISSDGFGFEKYANGWYRVYLKFVRKASTLQLQVARQDGGVIGQSTFIYGVQLEQGNLSSYIPTNGLTVQRAAETCNESGNSEVFNDSQGILMAEISALANDSTYKFLGISDGTTTNRVNIWFNNNNTLNAFVGGVGTFDSVVNILNFNKAAIKYKSGDYAFWVNGFEVEVSTSTSGIHSGLNQLNFDIGNGSNDFYGNTKEIAYYDEILTDEELEYLTSYRSLNEMVTELNLNAL